MTFTASNKEEKSRLLKILQDPNTEDSIYETSQMQLRALNRLEKQGIEARKKALDNALIAINDLKISFADLVGTLNFDVNEVKSYSKSFFTLVDFTDEEIRSYAEAKGWLRPLPSTEKKIRKQRTPNAGLVLFAIQPPDSLGAPTQIIKGRNLVMGAKMDTLRIDKKEIRSKLLGYKIDSEEVNTYLASSEGNDEIAKIVTWLEEAPPLKK